MKKIKKLGLLLIVLFSFMIGNNVVKGEQPFYNITGLYFKTNEVEAGGRLYVDLYMGSKDSSRKLLKRQRIHISIHADRCRC